MSENPNPTVCGKCHTENPPNAEYCRECGKALTLAAEEGSIERDAAQRQDPLLDSTTPDDPGLGATGSNPRTVPDPSKESFPTD
jgi:hypothetical protein